MRQIVEMHYDVIICSIDFPPHSIGGEAVVVESLANFCVANGKKVLVLAGATNSNIGSETTDGFDILRIPTGRHKYFFQKVPYFYIKSAGALKGMSCDILYCARPVRFKRFRQKISHFHTLRLGEAIGGLYTRDYLSAIVNASFFWLDLLMSMRASKIIVAQEKSKRFLPWVSSALINTIPCGSNIRDFDLSKTKFDAQKPLRFLILGRLDRRKGILDAISALETLQQTRPEVRFTLTIIGDGPEQSKIRRKLKNSCLLPLTTQLGSLDHQEIKKVYIKHDILLAPAVYEPFGLTVIEATFARLVVVSSPAPINIGQIIIDFNRETALTDSLPKIMQKLEERHLPSFTNYEDLRERFDEHKINEQILDLPSKQTFA